jgi:hypothetical protein
MASVRALAAALLVGVCAARPTRAQMAPEQVVRFEVRSVSDSTFEFEAGRSDWVKPGLRGLAVDPRRRDVLVARFEVLRVNRGVATALVTGQTARVSTEHVALLYRPLPKWYVRRVFWVGVGMGTIVGLVAGAAVH